jgi:hypothetical protein
LRRSEKAFSFLRAALPLRGGGFTVGRGASFFAAREEKQILRFAQDDMSF